jgi:hypothetical protein
MIRPQIEYVGFVSDGDSRHYTLRIRLPQGETRDVVFVIRNEAFLARRLRYQDAPEVCYLKLQRVLAGDGEGPLPSPQDVSDEDLEAYRLSHAPKTALRSLGA